MQKILYAVVITLFLPICCFAQNIQNTSFDTNGPMGEVLFNQNADGEIVYSGIIEVPYSAEIILGLAREHIYSIEKKYNADVDDIFEGITKVACDVELPVGVKFIDVGVVGTWAKAASTVKFNLVIDVREGKYRYTLTHFITDRWRIPGEGKDNGQSNIIHWQRVNSLTMEQAAARGKKKDEYTSMINKEKASYKAEYNAVMAFIEGLKTFAVINDDF